jgi:hypothetical protein
MEDLPVTVCVATMCDKWTIMGASDRMLTAGDVEFEPQQTKVYTITSSIAIMWAGDSSLQAEITQKLQSVVSERIEAEPENWWKVEDIANLFCDQYNRIRLRKAEAAILAPLGLNNDQFFEKQQHMAPQLVAKLATDLTNYAMPIVQAIICGLDKTGAHIFTVQNEHSTCLDTVGFAAIGAGYWHADSQLMFSGHTKYKPMPETLLSTYAAKKRAEVAPGVGRATDMFMIGPRLGSYIAIAPHVMAKLDEIYITIQSQAQESEDKAKGMINQYIDEITEVSKTEDQIANPEDDGHEYYEEETIPNTIK